jgi:hypothetical protein
LLYVLARRSSRWPEPPLWPVAHISPDSFAGNTRSLPAVNARRTRQRRARGGHEKQHEQCGLHQASPSSGIASWNGLHISDSPSLNGVGRIGLGAVHRPPRGVGYAADTDYRLAGRVDAVRVVKGGEEELGFNVGGKAGPYVYRKLDSANSPPRTGTESTSPTYWMARWIGASLLRDR